MPTLESCKLNGVTVIARTHKDTSIFSWIMVKLFTLWHSNLGESFLLEYQTSVILIFWNNVYFSRYRVLRAFTNGAKSTEKALFREIYIFSKKLKLHLLDIHKRKLSLKFECHSVNGLTIIARKHASAHRYFQT